MMKRIQKTTCLFALLMLACAFGIFTPQDAVGDDRDLFRSSSDAPYIFILFDVTGSMWRAPDGTTPLLYEDDPRSKMFQAKAALYEVMEGVSGVNFGFATFPNQDELRVISKVYETCNFGPPNDDIECSWINPQDNSDYCEGIETNNDDADDDFFDWQSNTTFNVKFPSETTPSGLAIGDLVPLDWEDDNVLTLQQRLAPNIIGDPNAEPDFGVAPYFEDARTGNRRYHQLLDNDEKPFMAVGLTPLAESLNDFREWYEDWETDAIAADPEFECREVFVLLMTDGFETCDDPDDAADEAEALLAATGVQTYVVGFAVNNPVLDDIAEAGGTEESYSAADGDELVAVFNNILDSIQGQARTFSSAVVPSLQSAAGRNVFLSSFNPVTDAPVWPGRLDSYVVPVPYITTPDGTVVADRSSSARCTDANDIDEEGCWAWFASEEILDQAPATIDPTATTLNAFQFGTGTGDRRIFYGRERLTDDIPADRKCFLPSAVAATASSLCDPQAGDDVDLYGPAGMNLPDSNTWDEDAGEIFADLLSYRTEEIINTNAETETIDYVLGDIFHSQPTVTEPPGDTLLFGASLAGRLEPCGPRVDGGPEPYKESYACFSETHEWRRRMVLAGSNDGQLHFFDGGRPVDDLEEDPFGQPIVTYTAGTGKEIISFVPRHLLSTVAEMADGGSQIYGVDGPVTLGDVGIDPVHDGTPSANDREWRSVVVGGLREGGRSYYALDITQPDVLDNDNRPSNFVGEVPSCLQGAGCDYEFPMVLWEIQDDWDEDGNQAPDMAHTWSKPRIGRILVDDGSGDAIDKFVAIFGGGMDAEFKAEPLDPDTGDYNPWSGNYIYMVDIETGEIIYKRRVDELDGDGDVMAPAMVPSELAAVDTDFDTYIDTIYFGTTAGTMYKVDLTSLESINTFDVEDWSEADFSDPDPTPIVRSVSRIDAASWEPFAVFDTGGRPIYYPPSVVFFTELSQYALAFGGGDREDLWTETTTDGRFYFILDENWTDTTTGLPFDELDYVRIGIDDPAAGSDNYLTSPPGNLEPGWILLLTEDERITAKSLVISGVVFFNSFIPQPFVPADGLCSQTGTSQVFAVLASNADGLFVDPNDPDADGDRYQTVDDFATSPYVQSSGTDPDLPDGGASDPPEDDLSPAMKALSEKLKGLQPDDCKFANYTMNVLVDTTESGSQLLAPIPICIIERNFRQF